MLGRSLTNHHLRSFLVLACLAASSLVCHGFQNEVPDPLARFPKERTTMWKQVDDAINQGLPKSAIEKLDAILAQTLKDKAYPEAALALARKIRIETEIQGNQPQEGINRLKKEMESVPAEMKPILEGLLAQWYWSYFQRYRWQFQRRTAVAVDSSDDIATWDLPRIFREIDLHYSRSLENPQATQSIPIANMEALLDRGTYPDSYRPTLYDFLAYQAIEFYASGEQAGTKREDAFELDASSAALGSVDDFIAWEPQTTDKDSPKLKGIRLLQELLRFHKEPGSDPRLHAELERIRFVRNLGVGEEKDSREESLLRGFAEANAKHPLSAKAREDWARILVSQNELDTAHKIALQGKNAFPESIGGKLCHNLIQSIESKTVTVATERSWNNPAATIRVRYKNVNKIYFRLITADWNARLTPDRWRPDQFNPQDRNELLQQVPVRAWASDLAPTLDYQEAVHDELAPTELKPGYYFLLYSLNESFTPNENQLGACELWVTKLGLILRNRMGTQPETNNDPPRLEGIVVDNQTGAPIAGASVQSFIREQRSQRLTPGPTVTSNIDGFFRIPSQNSNTLIFVTHEGQSFASTQETYPFGYKETWDSPILGTLFTDRSIYRPGQTIHFKGILTKNDQKLARYEVAAGIRVKIELQDINGEVVETLESMSNDYGSFSGSFTAPRNRGTGQMEIKARVDGSHHSWAVIHVEEYKRPKFQVTLDRLKDQVKLNDSITVNGKAMSYTGTPIQEAKVRYRVVRAVRWPDWFVSCFFWRIAPYQQQPAQEIAHGWTQTKADGSFQIEFVAKPDRSVPEDDFPIFRYEIVADVTDGTGETRTGNDSVSIGYATAQANMRAKDWQSDQAPVEIDIQTSNLDGQAIAATGTVKLYRIVEPKKVPRRDLLGGGQVYRPQPVRNSRPNSGAKPARSVFPIVDSVDPTDFRQWAIGDLINEQDYKTGESGTTKINFKLPTGLYRAILESKDAYGKPVRSELNLKVLSPQQNELGFKLPHVFVIESNEVHPGETWKALWGTGYPTGTALVEFERMGKKLKSYWTAPGKTQSLLELPIDESMRGGVSVRVTFVRDNRLYTESTLISIPWDNKQLALKWERFRNKLEPGAKEKWLLKITGPDAQAASAELLATMYDASLDAFQRHDWPMRIGRFYQESSQLVAQFENVPLWLMILEGNLPQNYLSVEESYRRFPESILMQDFGRLMRRGLSVELSSESKSRSTPAAPAMQLGVLSDAAVPRVAMAKSGSSNAMGGMGGIGGVVGGEAELAGSPSLGDAGGGATPPKTIELDSISPRKNLNETAFFFPHLVSDSEGNATLEFTMPEALTKWRFMALAHDRNLRSGSMTDSIVSAKDLMVQPNPPRFLREGDVIEFTAKVTNQSNGPQQGTVALHVSDAIDEKDVDALFGLATAEQKFELAGNESRSFRWRIRVPEGARPVIFKTVAATDKLSDGEQGMVPVLSNKVLVSEAIPLPIRGKTTKEFQFKKLMESANSPSIRHQSLTLEMTSQPAWYAVFALPYLMEYPYECSEQVFNRLYANSLAKHIAESRPQIAKVFETWRTLQPEALDSPLVKNKDLQSILLEETPWLRNANNESQARRNVGLLFDGNRLNAETQSQWRKLAEMQRPSGLWPWFPGGPDNEYLSLYITTGFGRLRQLNVPVDESLAIRSLDALDAWMHKQYEQIRDKDPKRSDLSSTIALYLYGRSFFLNDRPIPEPYQVALKYWLGQAKDHWVSQSRQSQAHLAIALKRFGEDAVPSAILKSFKERSVSDEELGMFWRDTERSWWWYHAPIETQAIMIEAFDEVAGDEQSVEACKTWLLKQKQTQDWKTTKATADAVYALLRRGKDWLGSDALVTVQLADKKIEPQKVERGTGYYEQKFTGAEIRPEMGKVTVTKPDDGISWGGLHWEYLEEIGKVTSHDGTPLKLEKKLFRRVLTATGPVLEEVAGPVEVGDELVCRIVLRTDRDMEYVHLKDYRGSGTEPVNVLSGYRFQDGLGYYESTRDTATHFFIDYLRKGTYVFEYNVRVQLVGKYPMGYASIECMYAPEFNSHSEGMTLEVK